MKQQLALYGAAFISGAAAMILEIDGVRILAQFLGSSIVVWTSIIGVILASLSVGYWVGGRWVDRAPRCTHLAAALFLAACFVGLIAFFHQPILGAISKLDIRLGATAASLILFCPANVMIGVTPPFVVRLLMHEVGSSGTISGTVSAVSTVGSIAGTFGAGFVLIPLLGSTKILFVVAAFLVLASLLASAGILMKTRALFLLLLLLPAFRASQADTVLSATNPVDIDTQYNRILLADTIDQETGRPIRTLVTDPHGIQSMMYLDAPEELAASELRVFRLAAQLHPRLNHALLIGGGALLFARDFVALNPHAQLDVAEIDPMLTRIARQYFSSSENPRLSVFHEDGRRFVAAAANGKYSAVYVNAFNAASTVPFHLTTKEMVEQIARVLDDDGVAMVNVISAVDGPRGKFMRAEYATYRAVFPHVYVVPMGDPRYAEWPQNVVLIALKKDSPLLNGSPEISDVELAGYIGGRRTSVVQDVPVLTDEFAPIEQYMIAAGL
ncbi:MAG: fused MFS/spermidine synthase [Planctomycetes bacterium]|nr:fused MFS/spermidine synthase [Planctomycetota bacterium]